jgi:hypothetical protein
MQKGIPAMIADNQMRYRDERFAEQDKYKGKPDPLSEKPPGSRRKSNALAPQTSDSTMTTRLPVQRAR